MGFWQDLTGNTAADALSDANKKLNKTNKQVAAIYAPYTSTGTQGFGTLAGSYGVGGPGARQMAVDTYQASPGYQWQLGEGLRAVQDSAAAQGALGSGGTLRALMQYGSGLANQDYGNWQQGLGNLANLGFAGTQGTANARLGTGSQMAGNIAGAGAVRTNAAGAMFNAGTNLLGRFIGNQQQQQQQPQSQGSFPY